MFLFQIENLNQNKYLHLLIYDMHVLEMGQEQLVDRMSVWEISVHRNTYTIHQHMRETWWDKDIRMTIAFLVVLNIPHFNFFISIYTTCTIINIFQLYIHFSTKWHKGVIYIWHFNKKYNIINYQNWFFLIFIRYHLNKHVNFQDLL